MIQDMTEDKRPIQSLVAIDNIDGRWEEVGINGITKIIPYYEKHNEYQVSLWFACYAMQDGVEKIQCRWNAFRVDAITY